jgi:hypothetical protein
MISDVRIIGGVIEGTSKGADNIFMAVLGTRVT